VALALPRRQWVVAHRAQHVVDRDTVIREWEQYAAMEDIQAAKHRPALEYQATGGRSLGFFGSLYPRPDGLI
jgi:hypothetical protein